MTASSSDHRPSVTSSLSLFFSFSVLAAPWRVELLGKGSDLGHSCDLSHSCSHASSLTYCAGLGIEPASRHSQDTANPVVLQREHPNSL